MQKALVLGSTGFFGRHFVEKAKDLFELTCLDSKSCDLLTNKICDFKDIKYDYIFYFAVKTEAGGYCQKHPGEQFLINQTMNKTILNYRKNHQPQAKFVTFGSSCSYSDNSIKTEDNYLTDFCETGYETYGMIKRMLLIGLRALEREYGMKYLFFVPSCFYGPNYDKTDKHFIYDIVKKICNAKYNGETATLWGDGHQKRELIYVKDAANILLEKLPLDNEVINLSTGQTHSMREYASIICNLIDYDFCKIEFDTTKPVGAREKKFVIDKLKGTVFTNVEEGIKDVINFYINNYME